METLANDKVKKRLDKKVRKARHIAEKQSGITCTTAVTKYIAICNAGLVNGLSEEAIYEHFSKYGALETISMLPGKSCAFVSFKDLNAAVLAYEGINSKLNLAQGGKPLHLSFAEGLPQTELLQNGKPPGCTLIENFITEHEEELLLNSMKFEGNLKHRQVKHYGYEFRYDINNVDKDKPLEERIPEECEFLWERLKGFEMNFCPDQLTVNSYRPGQGIPPHIDTHSAFEDPILSLSLGSATVMDFKGDAVHYSVFLPRRSLLVMSGEARYAWTHGITPRKLDIVTTESGLSVMQRGTRVSFTFRKVLKGECRCEYKSNCDSQSKSVEIEDRLAAELERSNVLEVYDNIADHFSDTRHKPWPNVLDFVQSFRAGSILIDVGCGNGKYLGNNKNNYEVGCDSSTSLLKVCLEKHHQVFSCNCLYMPLQDNLADGVISIAVIHHLANSERRLQALREITRILRVAGRALIYVWAKDQNKNSQKSTYLKQDRKNRKGDVTGPAKSESVAFKDISLPVHTNRTQFQHKDVLVPWKLKNGKSEVAKETYLRFYHVFDEGELEILCGKIENVRVVRSYYDQGNWCVMLQKIR